MQSQLLPPTPQPKTKGAKPESLPSESISSSQGGTLSPLWEEGQQRQGHWAPNACMTQHIKRQHDIVLFQEQADEVSPSGFPSSSSAPSAQTTQTMQPTQVPRFQQQQAEQHQATMEDMLFGNSALA